MPAHKRQILRRREPRLQSCSVVAAQLQAQQRIGSNSYVLLRVAGAQQSDHLKDILDYRTILGGQIAYYYNTIVGPVGATLGYSNRTKKPYFFLNLGYEF